MRYISKETLSGWSWSFSACWARIELKLLLRMEGHIDGPSKSNRLRGVYLQVNDNWFLTAAHNDALARLVRKRVDLLMGHKWRDINEVPLPRLVAEFKMITPPHPSTPTNYI